jgi:hypothetical protein
MLLSSHGYSYRVLLQLPPKHGAWTAPLFGAKLHCKKGRPQQRLLVAFISSVKPLYALGPKHGIWIMVMDPIMGIPVMNIWIPNNANNGLVTTLTIPNLGIQSNFWPWPFCHSGINWREILRLWNYYVWKMAKVGARMRPQKCAPS